MRRAASPASSRARSVRGQQRMAQREVQRHQRRVHRHLRRRRPAPAPRSSGRQRKPATSPSWLLRHQPVGQRQVIGMQPFDAAGLRRCRAAGAARCRRGLRPSARAAGRLLPSLRAPAPAHGDWPSGTPPPTRLSYLPGSVALVGERCAIHRWVGRPRRVGDIAVGMRAQRQRAPEARRGPLHRRQPRAVGRVEQREGLVAPGADQALRAQRGVELGQRAAQPRGLGLQRHAGIVHLQPLSARRAARCRWARGHRAHRPCR